MADSIDARTRAVDKMKAEPGKEMAAYQAAENQLLAIRAEQKQNLAMARAQSAATVQQNNTIAQAAEVAAAGGGAAQVQQVPINAATQGVLGKYGMGPTVSKSTQRSTQTVTKQNITINNYNTTTNNTTNNVPNTGPVQGRPVVVNRDDTGRFKVWVSNVLAKQNEQAAIRDKEYEKRESALSRSANRMTRKLESISSNLSEKLDPRRATNSFSDSLKKILKLIGITAIAANFPKIVTSLVSVENKVKNFLDYIGITGRDERAKAKKDSRLLDDIKYIISGKRGTGSDVSLGSVIMEFFKGNDEHEGLIDLIKSEFKLWAEQRSNALKSLKMPDISLWGAKNIGKSLQAVMGYLGNVLQIIIGGPNAAVNVAAKAGREESKNDFFRSSDQGGNAATKNSAGEIIGADGKEHKTTLNDAVLDRTRTLVRSDINSNGELSDNLAASIRQSSYTADDITGQNGHGKLNILGILEGMKNIEKSINKFDHTAVDPSLLEALEKIGVDVSDIGKNTKEFRYVSVERTEKEKELDGNSRATHKLKLVEVGDDNYPEDKYPTVTEAEGPWSFFGKGKIPGLSDKGTVSYPILTKEDMSKIKSALSTITGKEKISFDAEDVQSTKAIGEYLKTKSDREVHDTYKRSIEHAAEALEQQADYKRKAKEAYDNSTLSGVVNRVDEEIVEPVKNAINSVRVNPNINEPEYEEDKSVGGGQVDNSPTNYGTLTSGNKTFDVDAAISEIKKDSGIVSKDVTLKDGKSFKKEQRKSQNQYTGMCYRHVAQAIDIGLGKNTSLFTELSNRTDYSGTSEAKDAGPKLEKMGFEKLSGKSKVRPGDVAVFQPTDPSKAGHIAMNIGNGRWASDFIQGSFTGNVDPNAYSSYELYRFGGGDNSTTSTPSFDIPVQDVVPDNTINLQDKFLAKAEDFDIPRKEAEKIISKAQQQYNGEINFSRVSGDKLLSSNGGLSTAVGALLDSSSSSNYAYEIQTLLNNIYKELAANTRVTEVGVKVSADNVDATRAAGEASAQAGVVASATSQNNITREQSWT